MKNHALRSYAFVLIAGLVTAAGCAVRMGRPPQAEPLPFTIEQPAAEKTDPLLFTIERNTNANVVHYDANLTAGGDLDPARPVTVYWVLLAEDGRRENLNWLEKKKAYGVKTLPAADGYTLKLAAAPWLPLTVKMSGGSARVEGLINGRPAVMERMFIQARKRLLGQKVEYIDLYGTDLESGEKRNERVIPK